MKWLESFFDFLASLKLAVIIIISLGIIAAFGTIYEARFDAEYAQKVVYKSLPMYIVMSALITNLLAVMIDRWPWKRHHSGFVLAHIGIIMLLVGSFITQRYGIDGSMVFGIGKTERYITVSETEFSIFASQDGNQMERVFHRPVDFFSRPPSKEKLIATLGTDSLEVTNYVHYGIRQSEIVRSDKMTDGPAVRVQLQNQNFNISNWIVQAPDEDRGELRLGPASIVLTRNKFHYDDGNVIVIIPGEKAWRYEIYSKDKAALTKSGSIIEGTPVATGWMGIELTLLKKFDHARENITYKVRERPTPMTRPAVEVSFNGEKHWVGLNSVVKVFGKDRMYWVNFANRRIDAGISLLLKNFKVGRYQGTMRASSYESEVEVPGLGEQVISMNEPLHFKDYTFYQASFEQDEKGQPTASVLSVNYDPGLWLKYLGSFLIVLGSILLFYFKRATFFSKREVK